MQVSVGPFIEMSKMSVLKVNAGVSKVMAIRGKKGSVFEVLVDGAILEDVSAFKYSGCVLSGSGTDGAECRSNGVNGTKVADSFRTL